MASFAFSFSHPLAKSTSINTQTVRANVTRRFCGKIFTSNARRSKSIWSQSRPTQITPSKVTEMNPTLCKKSLHSFTPRDGQNVRFLHQAGAPMDNRAFIALGSNLGDRINMIEQACREIDDSRKIKVVRTSSLWETKAMYVQDQDKFINGVCEVETWLSPLALLDELQAIEKKMGRVKIIDKGPRNIDLDILLYNDSVYSDERLTIPHALMLEREFVLRPLCELIPEASLPAKANLPTGSLQSHLMQLPASKEPLSPLTRLCPSLPDITATRSDRDTRIMAILNITPDSFSDGGQNYGENLHNLPRKIKSAIEDGATILDVGGLSTRPGSNQHSSEVELDRVIPVIKLIRELPEARDVAVSIDTYRADVARQAVKAGADIVNDVSAGLLDDDMLSTVAELGCTVCLMHMRGTPQTMNSLAQYPDGVIETVGRELLDRVRAAEAAGIRRWRIILDPGIGFAKNRKQNLELLRRMCELREYPGLQGLPWLVGTSRKKFIGDITGDEKPSDRVGGTGAAITAAIQGGADIIRVHDTKLMAKVAKMADAIWRV